MNQSNKAGDGTTRPLTDDVTRSAFVSVPAASSHRHQSSQATASGITASHLAAMAASSNNYAPVDHNAAFMMSNAAATIAAVAASAVQQITQVKAPQATTGTNTPGGPSSTLPTSLYHAALHSNRNALIAGATGPQPVTQVPHAALLTALANAGQTAAVQTIPSPSSAPGHTEAASATASSLLRPNAPVLSQPASTLASPALLSDMQSWSLEQLDQHIALLQQMNQTIPHSVAILRAEAERKVKKKNDKRVANRKSASNSRARKKALVEEMTKTNARLKKQAMILALLPDLVMTTTTDGEITFCSAQAERILRYKTDDLVGAKLFNLLVPSSRHALKSLIEELVHPGKAKAIRASVAAQARRGANRKVVKKNETASCHGASKNPEGNTNGNNNESARDSSRTGGNSTDDTSGAAIVSEQSFPLSVVEVESKQQPSQQRSQGTGAGTNENLDSSTSNSAGEDDGIVSLERQKKKSKNTRVGGDDYSSLSSETKNLRANNNLDRNVRWHNQRMMLEGNKKGEANNGPKDDVTGASVTANNATARLSSLEHCPKASRSKKLQESGSYESPGDQSLSDDSLLAGVEEKKKSEDASDDSGYRESNDSREESSSSWSDTSRSNDNRKKPLAPTCRMCLIRDDLTTVWCEVTSSIRNRSPDEDTTEDKATNSKSTESSDASGPKLDQELLLCLRPIRNSVKKVDESFRFIPFGKQGSSEPSKSKTIGPNAEDKIESDTIVTKSNSNNLSSVSLKHHELYKNRPPKKRLLLTSADTFKDSSNQKRAKSEGGKQGPNASETEKSVVESLMLMNKSSQ
jgi:PAS domain-containing protein